ncbi:cation diffusion facilitator family transporter [Methanobrevibacter curvatus]|uniref:Putative cation efflux system proteinc n=1 Tax=Methanobrevibacter curvatus TaxID=49547 RepID=A0A165Z998_9EURY|nr:cation diffusion facilitator family transporter [Methanobrevibacter curvatus]KZX10421.1 putative cation efflux system proteinc [Methanobrevibacter curvatus]
MDDPLRNKEGTKAAIAGIVGNIFLTTFNILVGIVSGSFALIAEGAHTLSDITTSIIAFIGFKIAQRPPDEEHPLGHGRAEAIAGLIIVLFLAFISYEILTQALEKILFSKFVETPSYLAAVMALIGLIINIIISRFQINTGKKINSPAIIADGKHQQTDIFSCIAILISVIASNLGFVFVDSFVGLLIGLFVLKATYEVGRDNLNNIMGKLPSQDIIDEIELVASSIHDVCGVHNVRINYFGSYATISLHVEVNPKLSLKDAHNLIHYTQRKIVDEIEIVQAVNAHVCPLGEEYDHEKYISTKLNDF